MGASCIPCLHVLGDWLVCALTSHHIGVIPPPYYYNGDGDIVPTVNSLRRSGSLDACSTDLAEQVADAARNLEILRDRDDYDRSEPSDKSIKSGTISVWPISRMLTGSSDSENKRQGIYAGSGRWWFPSSPAGRVLLPLTQDQAANTSEDCWNEDENKSFERAISKVWFPRPILTLTTLVLGGFQITSDAVRKGSVVSVLLMRAWESDCLVASRQLDSPMRFDERCDHDLMQHFWWSSGMKRMWRFLLWKWDDNYPDGFVTGYTSGLSGKHDAIWVVVDRLTKIGTFLHIRNVVLLFVGDRLVVKRMRGSEMIEDRVHEEQVDPFCQNPLEESSRAGTPLGIRLERGRPRSLYGLLILIFFHDLVLGDGILGKRDVLRMRATLRLTLLYGLPHMAIPHTDIELTTVIQAAVQAMLPQIRE
ncbi:hypothetical protein Tco_1394157 [Tanacetum coccineum]